MEGWICSLSNSFGGKTKKYRIYADQRVQLSGAATPYFGKKMAQSLGQEMPDETGTIFLTPREYFVSQQLYHGWLCATKCVHQLQLAADQEPSCIRGKVRRQENWHLQHSG